MDIEDQFSLDHLLFKDRKCRSCGEMKELLSDYYIIRKSKRHLPSSYAYDCKDCTIKRLMKNKKSNNTWEYPDW